jgi:hypothetical protein
MSVETVTIVPRLQIVTFKSGQQITIEKKDAQVVVHGIVGPSGPAGGDVEWATQIFMLADTQQEFELSGTPIAGSIFVYLNGLLERFWELTDITLTLEDAALAGDTVIITYQKEI